MKKYFKTIDEQIELLRSKGLIIEDETRAKDKLLNYNYYKLINGTRAYLMEGNSNKYRPGISFRDVEKLHEFDKNIKKFFLNSILDIERHLRSIISYVFMKYHPEANAYLNPLNFNKETSLVSANIHTLSKTLETYKEEENYKKSMDYYSRKYEHVPFWFLINFISFGKLVNFYQTMKNEEAYEVANTFTKFLRENRDNARDYFITDYQFESFIINIKDIRNVVAHDNLLLGYECENSVAMIDPIHEQWNINKEDPRKDVFNVYLVMQVFLSKSQYRELTFNLQKSMETLEKEIDKKAFSMVLRDLGFPREFY